MSIVALEVFDHSENTADQDDIAGDIQNPEVSHPRNGTLGRRTSWSDSEALMETHQLNDEEAENAGLTQKTGNNNLFTQLVITSVPEDCMPPPPACSEKAMTSPVTKTRVTHFTGIKDSCSAWRMQIRRPRII